MIWVGNDFVEIIHPKQTHPAEASSATAEQIREHELMLEHALFREYPEHPPVDFAWSW